ncbi:NAD-dependent epimerase [Flavobacterium sp. WC2430]|uniref:NAD-dependent epimerase n=1 Tax=Flavobacterium sp. WC2430 TaxID=3234137 RepID=UPI0034656541
MKILVTGAAGFIGFHLVNKLIEKGIEVIGIDNINDYYDVNLKFNRLKESGIIIDEITKEGNLVQSLSYLNYYFAKIDLVDLSKLEKLFKEQQFTHVINLAAQAGVRYSLENPHAYIQSNVVGFVNILECCRYNNIQHLVYASSSSVYGANAKIPFSEEDRVDHPVSLYAATKRSNELMAYSYSHLYNLPTTGLRFFTVYGPWGRPDMAPMLFADAIMKGKSIKIFNNGDMQRDFTYIDDIVEGIERLITKIPIIKPKAEIFNIGNSKPVDLMEFIYCLENSLNIKALKEFYPMQDGDVKMTYADTSCLNKKTKYIPKTELKEGVSKFISWYLNYNLFKI